MLVQFLIFSAGLGVLYFGAEWLVRGAASLALRYGIRRIVVGITIVALGTSMPEFVINFFAALAHEDSLALGNIVGSNISNIALILGTSALVLPMVVRPSTLRKEYPIMMGVMILFYVVALDGVISKIDGLILVLCLVLFMIYLVIDGRRHARRVDDDDAAPVETSAAMNPVWKKVLFLIGGIAFLAVGARLMVYSAVNIAESMGIEPVVVGLTIVAVGTSLPELAASLVSAVKQEADMSIGNVLGSNLLNVLFVVGLVALIRPLQVDAASLSVHFPVMLGFSALLLPVAWTSYRISRFEGGLLLTAFLSYIIYLVYPYI
jgi:cation:H+ antiporter